MNELSVVLLASWLAGFAAFIGGMVAMIEWSEETEAKPEFIHGIVAFGGGILLAAVSFALAPEGMSVLPPVVLAAAFVVGGLAFAGIDEYISTRSGSRAQFMAMMMDFVPEAISLGAVFGHDHRLGVLLAGFIGAQNLPEGFNAFREMLSSGNRPRKTLTTLAAISLAGPIAASLGYFLLQDHKQLTGGIMSVAAGGILYLIFQDIAPQAAMKRRWLPATGAVLGFVVGMVGKQIIG